MPSLPDVLHENCGTRRVLDLLGDKWTPLLIIALSGGTRRFGELSRALPGVSQKVLTQTLRKLERDGLVLRRVFAEVPPRVEYTLTDLGCEFLAPIRALCEWAETHEAALRAVEDRRREAELQGR